MPTQPANPEPAHPDVDSMLSRKFGKEVANYFSGSPLNRLAFLRADNVFLSKALKHPSEYQKQSTHPLATDWEKAHHSSSATNCNPSSSPISLLALASSPG